MENKLLYMIFISGRVQGVGFRWNVANEAIIRGITGFVKNLSDGGVYIEAEGYKEHLDAFVEWCRKGPGRSVVKSIKTESSPPVNYSEFRIEL